MQCTGDTNSVLDQIHLRLLPIKGFGLDLRLVANGVVYTLEF